MLAPHRLDAYPVWNKIRCIFLEEILPFDTVRVPCQNTNDRRFRYCSEYDNGATPTSPLVKMNSNPLASCSTGVRVCLDGPNKGVLCGGSDSFCDSSPGAGDGECDACPVVGGVTTEGEMFVFLATYY